VHNDPRVGESPAVMAALRSQLDLAMAAWQGMKVSYDANEEVANVRSQLTKLMTGNLPTEVAAAATALDTKLATIGGPQRRGAGRFGPPRQPGSLLPFLSINNQYNTVLGPLTQNGIDMAPTKAMVDTLESSCHEFQATASGWQAAVTTDLPAFNNMLAKNNLPQLRFNQTTIATPPNCTFGSPARTGGRK